MNDYGGATGRDALWTDLAKREYIVTGVICSAEPIMTKWKWWLAAKVSAKIFIIKENADYFWVDRWHFTQLRRFVVYRLHPSVYRPRTGRNEHLDLGCCRLEIPRTDERGSD